MRHLKTLTLVALIATASLPAFAGSDMEMKHESNTPHAATMSDNAYAGAMEKMHQNMPMESSGDVDVDFIKGMIPHHQGAIDMAEIALQKSQDPFVRKMATDIVTAQKNEIAAMEKWLADHQKAPQEK